MLQHSRCQKYEIAFAAVMYSGLSFAWFFCLPVLNYIFLDNFLIYQDHFLKFEYWSLRQSNSILSIDSITQVVRILRELTLGKDKDIWFTAFSLHYCLKCFNITCTWQYLCQLLWKAQMNVVWLLIPKDFLELKSNGCDTAQEVVAASLIPCWFILKQTFQFANSHINNYCCFWSYF